MTFTLSYNTYICLCSYNLTSTASRLQPIGRCGEVMLPPASINIGPTHKKKRATNSIRANGNRSHQKVSSICSLEAELYHNVAGVPYDCPQPDWTYPSPPRASPALHSTPHICNLVAGAVRGCQPVESCWIWLPTWTLCKNTSRSKSIIGRRWWGRAKNSHFLGNHRPTLRPGTAAAKSGHACVSHYTRPCGTYTHTGPSLRLQKHARTLALGRRHPWPQRFLAVC